MRKAVKNIFDKFVVWFVYNEEWKSVCFFASLIVGAIVAVVLY